MKQKTVPIWDNRYPDVVIKEYQPNEVDIWKDNDNYYHLVFEGDKRVYHESSVQNPNSLGNEIRSIRLITGGKEPTCRIYLQTFDYIEVC